ncbi:hypothetical protein Goshw_029691 [Gossypium schwendimanii]|uniref:Uncharacterized protein n=1 Tax=Gossypium schwendimanii TaxID=34291 RepID=A0A7J9NCH3_GOSSC|nr:hypothetical protein [Gossypium schwendimanii]
MANVEEEGDDGPLYPSGFIPPHALPQAENNPVNPVIPDFKEAFEKEKVKEEFPKQFEERWKWVEEKFRAMESTERYGRIDAKDLSLVPDLVQSSRSIMGPVALKPTSPCFVGK